MESVRASGQKLSGFSGPFFCMFLHFSPGTRPRLIPPRDYCTHAENTPCTSHQSITGHTNTLLPDSRDYYTLYVVFPVKLNMHVFRLWEETTLQRKPGHTQEENANAKLKWMNEWKTETRGLSIIMSTFYINILDSRTYDILWGSLQAVFILSLLETQASCFSMFPVFILSSVKLHIYHMCMTVVSIFQCNSCVQCK